MNVRALVSTLSVLLLVNSRTADGATICDVVDQGTTFDPSEGNCDIFVMHESFRSMVAVTEEIKLRHKAEEKLFHEGPVLFDDALYFVTNRLGPEGDGKANSTWGKVSPPLLHQYIEVWKLDLESDVLEKQDVNVKLMANGMTKTADGKNILMLSQGFNTTGGAIFELDRETMDLKLVLDSYFCRQFNSPNDIEITSDGLIFFSDPPYGFEQGKQF